VTKSLFKQSLLAPKKKKYALGPNDKCNPSSVQDYKVIKEGEKSQ
jgi:hypothetical protein